MDLVFFAVIVRVVLVELLLDLEEALFDFFFDLWFQLFLKVMHLEILSLEIFKRLRFWILIWLIIFIDRFGDFKIGILGIVPRGSLSIDQWQIDLGVTLLGPELRVTLLAHLGVAVVVTQVLLKLELLLITLELLVHLWR